MLEHLEISDLVHVRIAAKIAHEDMLDTPLDLWDLQIHLDADELRALAPATVIRKFKQLPAQRCSCASANAFARLDFSFFIIKEEEGAPAPPN